MDRIELSNYAKTLYESNLSCKEIKNALMRRGVDEVLAMEIVDEIRTEKNTNGKKALGAGLVILILGIIATVNSYVQAEPGETFSVYWKAMVMGVVGILYGIIDWAKSLEKKK